MAKFIYTFMEISQDINLFLTDVDDPAVFILKNYKFNSSKSLVDFLNKNKDVIIANIPETENEILESLEIQGFLEYINLKWYKTTELDKIITPEEILDISIKFRCITSKNIMNYILEDKNEYNYEIRKNELQH